VFSESELELMFWLLEVNGVENMPKIDKMKRFQEHMQRVAGFNSIKYEGALGNTYYVNDLGQIIAQVCIHICTLASFIILPSLLFEGNGQS
jgi:hypothetical protein